MIEQQQTIQEQETRHGLARLHITQVPDPKFRLVLHHGAGGGVDSPDLKFISENCPRGNVIRVEQPWRVAGKKIAPAPRILDEGALDILLAFPELPLILGGRSAGARVACRTALQVGAHALLLLAFPLHPPGKAERSRAAELEVDLPKVIIQGERDPFGRPEEFSAVPVLSVAGAGHDLGPVPLESALSLLTG